MGMQIDAAHMSHRVEEKVVRLDPPESRMPPIKPGIAQDDRPHTTLDGAKHTPVAGIIKAATAIDSVYSRSANLATHMGVEQPLSIVLESDAILTTGDGSPPIVPDAPDVRSGRVSSVVRGWDEDVLVKDTRGGNSWKVMPYDPAPWSVPELAGLGVGMVVVASLVGKVF